MSTQNVKVNTSQIQDVENMKIHDVLVNSDITGPAVLIVIHDLSSKVIPYAVRLYALEFEFEDQEFYPQYEIEAFSFDSHDEALKFANRVMTMSAIEMLIILNAIQGPDEIDAASAANAMIH